MIDELWDILDANGKKKGYTKSRKETLGKGEYHKVVHIWIMNNKNDFLIQKRSSAKKEFPGIWATTGGAVLAGETSLEGIIREVREEIGIHLEKNEIEKVFNYCPEIDGYNGITDVFFVNRDIDPDTCVLDLEEVEKVKYVKKDKMIKNSQFYNYEKEIEGYYYQLFKHIKNRNEII